MRILLAGPLDAGDATKQEVDKYLKAGHNIVVNTFAFEKNRIEALQTELAALKNGQKVTFTSFDPDSEDALTKEITKDNLGYNAIVYPAERKGFTANVVAAAKATTNPLQVVGCPNDVLDHLPVKKLEEQGVKVVKSSEIHKDPVARYEVTMMEYVARRMGELSNQTGKDGAWPHDKALTTTRSIKGQTLGMIGASGKDGSAVAIMAAQLGMDVIALRRTGDGSAKSNKECEESNKEMEKQGFRLVSLDELVEQSDFISINSNRRFTGDLIGKDQFAKMKQDVIILCPAGAEIINKEALKAELVSPTRKLGKLIMDMPYVPPKGDRGGENTFRQDPDNAMLKEEYGVIFTPRMGGYNIQSYTQGVTEVAGIITKKLQPPGLKGSLSEEEKLELKNTIMELAKQAGENAKKLKEADQLDVKYKEDNTPYTNADKEAEEIIRDGLKQKGYNVNIIGEELGKIEVPGSNITVVMDGIDGTKNFINGAAAWCTSVSVMEGDNTIIGVVHNTERGETLSAIQGQGAERTYGGKTKPLKTPKDPPRDVTYSIGSYKINGSNTTREQIAEDIEKSPLRGSRREQGSIALSLCDVARGSLSSFIQGNAKLHDCSAGLLIAREAGAGIAPTTQRPPTNPQEEPTQDIVATNPALLKDIHAIFNKRTANVGQWTGVSVR